jgi:type VI secretion system secreted protein VgrG
VEISSDQAIRLRVGDSSILITSSCVQIATPKLRLDADTIESSGDVVSFQAAELARIEGKKAFLLSQGASVCLTANVKIDGSGVHLKKPPDASDGPAARSKPPSPTRLKLTDQDGNPVPGERFVITLDDGTERAGVLDENGERLLPALEGKATIRFPELPGWKGG